MNDWTAIYVSSRHEKKVQDRLLALDIEAYTPLRRSLRQWSDRRKWVLLPLLPGYVLVRPGQGQRDRVLQQPGVVAFVRSAGQDAMVRQCEVDTLRRIEEHGYEAELLATEYAPGDRVCITQGPLRGLRAEVLFRSGSNTVCAFLISGLEQRIKVHLPQAILTPERAAA